MFSVGGNIFCYDSDVFEAAIKAYENSILNLNKLLTDTQNSIAELKTKGWNSEAGRVFFENYTNEWSPILTDYIDLLTFLKECVEKGKTEFNILVEEAEKISI